MNQSWKRCMGLLLVIICLFACAACGGNDATMPYGSDEYENGEWSVEELVSHLEELGFDDIDVEESESRHVSEISLEVRVEDTESDSWFTEYKDFEKGEPARTWRKVRISVTAPIPVLTTENCPDLVDFLRKRYGSSEDIEVWQSFMEEHSGEYIEFDGTITDWYDELWFASGITFTVSFEDNDDITFSWSGMTTSEFGFANDYSTGCVQEGIPAHVVIRIGYAEEDYWYGLESIQLGSE